MTVDVVQALLTGEAQTVTRPTRVGVERGWRVARFIVADEVPRWCVAAGITSPVLPSPVGFDDLPAILAALDSIDVSSALHLTPDLHAEGLRLAWSVHVPAMRAVETALDHARYPPEAQARLCRIAFELERLLPLLAALALARHRKAGMGEFDLAPWTRAREALAVELAP